MFLFMYGVSENKLHGSGPFLFNKMIIEFESNQMAYWAALLLSTIYTILIIKFQRTDWITADKEIVQEASTSGKYLKGTLQNFQLYVALCKSL